MRIGLLVLMRLFGSETAKIAWLGVFGGWVGVLGSFLVEFGTMFEEFDWGWFVAESLDNRGEAGFNWIRFFQPNGSFGAGIVGWNGPDTALGVSAIAVPFYDELVVETFADERGRCLADDCGETLGID
jgi:hypothetical protein